MTVTALKPVYLAGPSTATLICKLCFWGVDDFLPFICVLLLLFYSVQL